LLARLTRLPGTIFSRPVEVLSLSNGKSMVRLRQRVSSEALLALWDPASNSLTDLTSAAPALFQQGWRPCPLRRSFESPCCCQRFQRGIGSLRFGKQRPRRPAYTRHWFSHQDRCQRRWQPLCLDPRLQREHTTSVAGRFPQTGRRLYAGNCARRNLLSRWEISVSQRVIFRSVFRLRSRRPYRATHRPGPGCGDSGRLPGNRRRGRNATPLRSFESWRQLCRCCGAGKFAFDGSGHRRRAESSAFGGPARWRNFCRPCRPELHFPCSTEIRCSISAERHRFRTRSNPGELSFKRRERRRQPDLLFPDRLARHRPGRLQLRSANSAAPPKRRHECGRRLCANLRLRLRQRSNKDHCKNRWRKCGRPKSGGCNEYHCFARPRCQLSFSSRAHRPADASGFFGQGQRFRFNPCRFYNVVKIIPVPAECPIVCETWFLQVPAVRSETAAHLFSEQRSGR
jgi:hypothetical protein